MLRYCFNITRYKYVLLFIALCMCSGCNWSEKMYKTMHIKVVIPDHVWTKSGAPISYKLVYPAKGGDLRSMYLPVGTREIFVEVQRGINVPVAAYPMGRLPPAGGVIPGQIDKGEYLYGNELELEYAYGPVAEMLLDLWGYSSRCETVCVQALAAELLEEGGGDPWTCNLERIKGAIVRGRLNRLQVCSKKEFSTSIEIPKGKWISGNCFFKGSIEVVPEHEKEGSERTEYTGGGTISGVQMVAFGGLYPGRHFFFSPDTGLELHIFVDKKGGCQWVYDSLSCFHN